MHVNITLIKSHNMAMSFVVLGDLQEQYELEITNESIKCQCCFLPKQNVLPILMK